MRDFSWKYFMLTGDVESYLLYREIDTHQDHGGFDGWEEDDEFADETGEPLN